MYFSACRDSQHLDQPVQLCRLIAQYMYLNYSVIRQEIFLPKLQQICKSVFNNLAVKQSFLFQINPKDLDLSCRTDLDLWNCSRRSRSLELFWKTELDLWNCSEIVFLYQNNPKDLDLSCKTDIDLWNCSGRKKSCLITEEIRYSQRSIERHGSKPIDKPPSKSLNSVNHDTQQENKICPPLKHKPQTVWQVTSGNSTMCNKNKEGPYMVYNVISHSETCISTSTLVWYGSFLLRQGIQY